MTSLVEFLGGAMMPAGACVGARETIRTIRRAEYFELATMLPYGPAHTQPAAKRVRIDQSDGNH